MMNSLNQKDVDVRNTQRLHNTKSTRDGAFCMFATSIFWVYNKDVPNLVLMKNYIQLVFSEDGKSCRVVIGNLSSKDLKYRDEVSSIIYGLELLRVINNDQAEKFYKTIGDSSLEFEYEDEPFISAQKLVDSFVVPPTELDDYIPEFPEFIPWQAKKYGTVGMFFLPSGFKSRMVVSLEDAIIEMRRLCTEPHNMTAEQIDVLFEQVNNSTLREIGTIDHYVDIIQYYPDDASSDDVDDYEED